jgi:hypothetical protein
MEERHRSATFADWNPLQYLADYYTRVEQDEELTLRFLTERARRIANRPVVLEFGIGPTVHHLLPIAPYVSEIHVADLLPANLRQVGWWQEQRATAHDWRPFTSYVLSQEGVACPGAEDVAAREALVRSQITRYLLCDAALANPLGRGRAGTYDCLLSCYCADSATDDKATWRRYMDNMLSLLRPGGLFITTALRNCTHYSVGDKRFPSANVNERDLERLFREHDVADPVVEAAETPEHAEIGYGSVLLAAGIVNRPMLREPSGSRISGALSRRPGMGRGPDSGSWLVGGGPAS